MILYRANDVIEKYVSTDGAYITEYVRIKIFTQEGTEVGNVEIPFRKEASDIKDVRARTIKPDRSIVDFEGKPFEKIIEKRSGEKYLAKTFTLPDVQPGCISSTSTDGSTSLISCTTSGANSQEGIHVNRKLQITIHGSRLSGRLMPGGSLNGGFQIARYV